MCYQFGNLILNLSFKFLKTINQPCLYIGAYLKYTKSRKCERQVGIM